MTHTSSARVTIAALFVITCLSCKPGATAEADRPAAGSPANPTTRAPDQAPTKQAGKCEAAPLAELVVGFSAVEQRDLVAEALPQLCPIPRVLDAYLQGLSRSRGAPTRDLSENERPPVTNEAALLELCPDAMKYVDSAASIDMEDRGRLYDLCDFKRFGIGGERLWIEGEDDTALMPWLALEWLQRHNATKRDATILASALVLPESLEDDEATADVILSGAQGKELSEAFANGKRGEGGSGEGTIGLGNVGLIGKGAPRPPAAGEGADTLMVDGKLNTKLVEQRLARHLRKIHMCFYNDDMKRNGWKKKDGVVVLPKLTGTVRVELVVAPSGAVTTASVDKKTLPKNLRAECVNEAIRDAKFPPTQSSKPVTITHELVVDS